MDRQKGQIKTFCTVGATHMGYAFAVSNVSHYAEEYERDDKENANWFHAITEICKYLESKGLEYGEIRHSSTRIRDLYRGRVTKKTKQKYFKQMQPINRFLHKTDFTLFYIDRKRNHLVNPPYRNRSFLP